MSYLKKIINRLCENIILQSILVLILILPAAATLGQYISSKFIIEKTGFSILFWPGVKGDFRIVLPVWVSIGLMLVSYLLGIVYMYKKRTLGKVVLIGLVSITLAQLVGSVVNNFTGWSEMQNANNMVREGIVNRLIFALWHDPVWEEIVFTGIPLLVLKTIKNKISKEGYKISIIMYFLIPSIICAVYHIPNHGFSRIIDTFLLHIAFEWLAVKYSFFASLVLHYLFDAIMVISLGSMKGISYSEMSWIVNNASLINTTFTIVVLSILALIPILIIWIIIQERRLHV